MKTRHRYIPLSEANVGMVLGASLNVVHRGMLSLTLPVGHALTDENLQQISTHCAEFICVAESDSRSDEQIAADVAQASARVTHIFDGADLGDPTLAALFDQVLSYRSA